MTASAARLRSACAAGPALGSAVSAEEIREVGAAAAGDLVERSAGDDLVEPGRERGVGPEPGEVFPRRYQGLLGDVLRVVVVTAKPQGNPVGHRGMPLHEHLVGIEVAFPGAGNIPLSTANTPYKSTS